MIEVQTTREEALAKRRAQNREAQRRFRLKQSQQKEKDKEKEKSSIQRPAPTKASSNTRPNECVFSSTCSLFGKYDLLDSFDMSTDSTSRCTHNDNSKRSESATSGSTSIESWLVGTTQGRSSNEAQRTDRDARAEGSQVGPRLKDRPPVQTSFTNLDYLAADTRGGVDNDPGSSWQSSLHIAAQRGHESIVRILLQQDANCNERDSDGLTPLFHACLGGHDQVVALLLQKGALISEEDEIGRTAIHLAVVYQQETILRLLLEHCKDRLDLINAYDTAGMTPLHTAVDHGFDAGVRVLLEHGASLKYRARNA